MGNSGCGSWDLRTLASRAAGMPVKICIFVNIFTFLKGQQPGAFMEELRAYCLLVKFETTGSSGSTGERVIKGDASYA